MRALLNGERLAQSVGEHFATLVPQVRARLAGVQKRDHRRRPFSLEDRQKKRTPRADPLDAREGLLAVMRRGDIANVVRRCRKRARRGRRRCVGRPDSHRFARAHGGFRQ